MIYEFPFFYDPFYVEALMPLHEPPTVYSLLEAHVNFDEQNKIPIAQLAAKGRKLFFDFDYPLSDTLTKEFFETLIINHFIMRRIGQDTVTAFKISLSVKLNAIMPYYNKLFDVLDGYELFKNNEFTKEVSEDTVNTSIQNRNINEVINTNDTLSSKTGRESTKNDSGSINRTASTSESANTKTDSTGDVTDKSDRRFSDLPQNQIEDVANGSYLTTYNLDSNTKSDTTTATGTSTGNSAVTDSTTSTDKSDLTENTIRSDTSVNDKTADTSENTNENANGKRNLTEKNYGADDKMRIISEYMSNRNILMERIFDELDELFYQLA